jgi:D-alanyl-D-alanine carboxypeptidase
VNPARAIAVVTVALLVLHGASAAALARSPGKFEQNFAPPYAAFVLDVHSGRALHQDMADEPRRPASLTKMMTLFLLFEKLEAGAVHLDTEMVVSEYASYREPTKLGLEPGETLMVQDAILGLVTHSANDAAVVVAEALGGTEPAFAELMTLKARSLGMHNTVYRNASGLPDDAQLTTARDQAILGRAIQARFPQYYHYFSTKSFTWRGRRFKSHNKLLGRVKGMDGIKTGYTRLSRFNLVSSVRRDGRHIVAVVLGGSTRASRDARMRTLIEQGLADAAPSYQRASTAE